ncbi:hypothetical protein BDZ45DRAFT_650222 [Acephala macrosclerotiorum]|nr:hypothetical protein BDZ45DRAFT_650222 [Acephala macrosclerotiorum]
MSHLHCCPIDPDYSLSTTTKNHTTIAATADRSKPYIPLAAMTQDGWSKEDEATATCFCGAVKLAFPTSGLGFVDASVCNCTDCRKITASMFASNFTIMNTHLQHFRGKDSLKIFKQAQTTTTKGNLMANYFYSTCGTLMYRVGSAFLGTSILRIGTVDDFNLHETKLRLQWEQFAKDRMSWVCGVEGAKKSEAMSDYL